MGPRVVATAVTKFMHRVHGARADARADGTACRGLPPEPADLDIHAQGPHVGAADAGIMNTLQSWWSQLRSAHD